MTAFRSYRKKKSYKLAVVIIVLAVGLSVYTVRNPSTLRSIVSAALYPFQWTSAAIWQGVAGIPSAIGKMRDLARDNFTLRQEIALLKPKLQNLETLEQENRYLRSALGFQQKGWQGRRLLAAQVVGKSPSPWFSILEINQGSRAGIKAGQTVIVEQGLVGTLIEVSLFSAKVMLITDPDSSVAATADRSRDFGVVEGTLGDKLVLKYVSAGGDVAAGDKISTSQISEVFPPGLPIGTVSKADKKEVDLFYHIELKPAVDFSRLEEVFVII